MKMRFAAKNHVQTYHLNAFLPAAKLRFAAKYRRHFRRLGQGMRHQSPLQRPRSSRILKQENDRISVVFLNPGFPVLLHAAG